MTRLSEDGSGTNEVKRDLSPFRVDCKPVHDNERFVYFQESAILDGKHFGRLDLGTMAFETLADAPRGFDWRNGFFTDGSVFCFDEYNRAMRYDCVRGVWSETSLSNAGKGMVAHPWQNGRVIELMGDGSVREVRVADERVVKMYASRYGKIGEWPEMLALCAPDGAFFLLVCDGYGKQPWRVFSSAADSWTETAWPTTGALSSTAFFDAPTQSVFYHMRSDDEWTCVVIV